MHRFAVPQWEERSLPSVQLTDVLPKGYYLDTVYAVNNADGQEHMDLLEWLNEYREPLQVALRNHQMQFEVANAGIPFEQVTETVAAVTHTNQWPLHRLLLASEIENVPEYQAAVSEVTPNIGPIGSDQYLYHYLLGIIVLRDEDIFEVSKENAVDTLASAIGQAALSSVVDVQLQYQPRRQMWDWYGYQWRYQNEYYGRVLHQALTAKIAAQTRKQLGMIVSNEDSHHLALDPYQLPEGYFPKVGPAVAMDLLNAVSASRNYGKLYDLMLEFVLSGRSREARDQLAYRIDLATKGRLGLEELESIEPEYSGFNTDIVELIEDACEIRPEYGPVRIMRLIEQAGD